MTTLVLAALAAALAAPAKAGQYSDWLACYRSIAPYYYGPKNSAERPVGVIPYFNDIGAAARGKTANEHPLFMALMNKRGMSPNKNLNAASDPVYNLILTPNEIFVTLPPADWYSDPGAGRSATDRFMGRHSFMVELPGAAFDGNAGNKPVRLYLTTRVAYETLTGGLPIGGDGTGLVFTVAPSPPEDARAVETLEAVPLSGPDISMILRISGMPPREFLTAMEKEFYDDLSLKTASVPIKLHEDRYNGRGGFIESIPFIGGIARSMRESNALSSLEACKEILPPGRRPLPGQPSGPSRRPSNLPQPKDLDPVTQEALKDLGLDPGNVPQP